jgi:adenosylcobinamide-GDP ribazoletransferase
VAVAIGWALAVALVVACLLPQQRLALVLAGGLVLLGAAGCARWLHRRLGGITGDTLGATQQITELLVLLGWLASARSVVLAGIA